MEIDWYVKGAASDGSCRRGYIPRTTWLWVVLSVPACGGAGPTPNSPGSAGELTRRDTTIIHEPCEVDSESAVRGDANRDGTPDVISVMEAGKVVCQWLDLNFDRVVDVWVYHSEDGSVRRRETDFDRDGRIDEIATWSGGKLVSRERATTLAGRLDTWLFFKGGSLERGERDANGDGVVDQWWEYSDAAHPDCAVVHSDTDGDGRPDPGTTVDICGSEGASRKQDSENRDDELDRDALLTETTEEPPSVAAEPPRSSKEKPTTEEPKGQEGAAP